MTISVVQFKQVLANYDKNREIYLNNDKFWKVLINQIKTKGG